MIQGINQNALFKEQYYPFVWWCGSHPKFVTRRKVFRVMAAKPPHEGIPKEYWKFYSVLIAHISYVHIIRTMGRVYVLKIHSCHNVMFCFLIWRLYVDILVSYRKYSGKGKGLGYIY